MTNAVADLKLPKRYMAHIAAKLASAEIIQSHEGVRGGYELKKKLSEIKLFEVLRLFEGDMRLVKCADSAYKCQWGEICGHQHYWKNKLTDKLVSVISSTTIGDLFSTKKYARNKKSFSTD